jgi:hypothetical protein
MKKGRGSLRCQATSKRLRDSSSWFRAGGGGAVHNWTIFTFINTEDEARRFGPVKKIEGA